MNKSLYQRIKLALLGARAGFSGEVMIPMEEPNPKWDTFAQRLIRYQVMEAYYHSQIYNDLLGWVKNYKRDRGLYRHVRVIYNPVKRLVDTYTSNIFGGVLDMEDASKGAIPILADDQIKQGIVRLWDDSVWQRHKSLFIRNGAMKGDVGLLVVEDRQLGVVRMEVIPPDQIADLQTNAIGQITGVLLSQKRYYRDDGYIDMNRSYVYSVAINEDEWITYKDGEEYAYAQDTGGNPVSRWANDYGFVPMVVQPHTDVGRQWGVSAFSGTERRIDEINDIASNLNDNLRKAVNPIYAITNTYQTGAVTLDTGRDEMKFITLPADAEVKELLAQIDVAGNLENIRNMLKELEHDLPELALATIRDYGSPASGAALRLMFGDADKRLTEAYGGYAGSLTEVQAMALYIGAQNGYAGYTQLRGRTRDDLTHYVKETPMFPDTLTLEQRLQIYQGIDNLPIRYTLQELDFPADEISKIELEIADKEAEALTKVLGAMGQGATQDGQGNANPTKTTTDNPTQEDAQNASI